MSVMILPENIYKNNLVFDYYTFENFEDSIRLRWLDGNHTIKYTLGNKVYHESIEGILDWHKGSEDTGWHKSEIESFKLFIAL